MYYMSIVRKEKAVSVHNERVSGGTLHEV